MFWWQPFWGCRIWHRRCRVGNDDKGKLVEVEMTTFMKTGRRAGGRSTDDEDRLLDAKPKDSRRR